MSEKRFTIHKESKYKEEWYAYPFCIKEDGEVVFNTIPLSIAEKVRDKLNEQQATIKQLQVDLKWSEARIKSRNDKIGEQQATIRRLQDLCGESDSENAKLRQKIAELEKELNDCEKFRYTVFKRIGDVLDE